MAIEEVKQHSTLWGVVKDKLQKVQGEGSKVTNQQIVDAMKAIANQNGYGDDFDQYAKDNFKVGNKIDIPGLCIEHGEVKIVEDEAPAVDEAEAAADEVSAEDDAYMVGQMGMTAFALKGMAKSTEYLARGYDLKYIKDKANVAQEMNIKQNNCRILLFILL